MDCQVNIGHKKQIASQVVHLTLKGGLGLDLLKEPTKKLIISRLTGGIMNHRYCRAISLLELAIVMVILGLLAGGILTAQTLIHAAEVNSVAAQIDRYTIAVQTFRAKYSSYPGDMNNATQYWPSAGGTGSDAACFALQTQTSNATCNGNGDEQIDNAGGVAEAERFMSWKHLANEGLIEGSYTGTPTGAAGTFTPLPGINVPAGKISNTLFDLHYISSPAGDFFSESILDQNFIAFFRTPDNAGNLAALKPEDASQIDVKFDDGSPVYGSIITLKKSATAGKNCTTADTALAEYDVANGGINCVLYVGGRI